MAPLLLMINSLSAIGCIKIEWGVREFTPNILILLHLKGSVAERLGRALQKLLQQFESARNLSQEGGLSTAFFCDKLLDVMAEFDAME